MRIAAFDVGVRNLAFVVTEGPTAVVAWEAVALPGKSLEDNVRALHEVLRAPPHHFDGLDAVLIERQPPVNRTMSCLAFALLAFFLPRVPAVHFVDPKTKLAGFESGEGDEGERGRPREGYRARKARSVTCVRAVLRGSPWLRVLDAAPKRDDLADAFALAYTWRSAQPVRL